MLGNLPHTKKVSIAVNITSVYLNRAISLAGAYLYAVISENSTMI